VLENRMLKQILGPLREEVAGEWRQLHNEKLKDLYSSRNIVWVIKSRKMNLARHVVCMREKQGAYRVLVGKAEERDHLEDLGIEGKIMV